MTEIQRSALMPYPAQVMYDIVNDVARYPDFLPWCGGVTIHQAETDALDASIQMRGAGFDHWFRTRNQMQPGKSIHISLVDGPFSELEGEWRFIELNGDGCKIELLLRFEIKHTLASAILAPAFTRIANTMVESFCKRAEALESGSQSG